MSFDPDDLSTFGVCEGDSSMKHCVCAKLDFSKAEGYLCVMSSEVGDSCSSEGEGVDEIDMETIVEADEARGSEKRGERRSVTEFSGLAERSRSYSLSSSVLSSSSAGDLSSSSFSSCSDSSSSSSSSFSLPNVGVGLSIPGASVNVECAMNVGASNLARDVGEDPDPRPEVSCLASPGVVTRYKVRAGQGRLIVGIDAMVTPTRRESEEVGLLVPRPIKRDVSGRSETVELPTDEVLAHMNWEEKRSVRRDLGRVLWWNLCRAGPNWSIV